MPWWLLQSKQSQLVHVKNKKALILSNSAIQRKPIQWWR
jgi:hypothetical protein